MGCVASNSSNNSNPQTAVRNINVASRPLIKAKPYKHGASISQVRYPPTTGLILTLSIYTFYFLQLG